MFCSEGITVTATVVDAGVTAEETAAAAAAIAATAATGAALAPVPALAPEAVETAAAVGLRRRSEMLQVNYSLLLSAFLREDLRKIARSCHFVINCTRPAVLRIRDPVRF
jgi:hypothetical protein